MSVGGAGGGSACWIDTPYRRFSKRGSRPARLPTTLGSRAARGIGRPGLSIVVHQQVRAWIMDDPTVPRPPREYGPRPPRPRGDVRRVRPSHRSVTEVPAGPGSPAGTTGQTARETHRRGGGRADALAPMLARQRTENYAYRPPIEFPILRSGSFGTDRARRCTLPPPLLVGSVSSASALARGIP